jgi:hypothetical protein
LHSVAFLLLATYSRLGAARPPSMQPLARQLADRRPVARGTFAAYASRLGDQPRSASNRGIPIGSRTPPPGTDLPVSLAVLRVRGYPWSRHYTPDARLQRI